MTLNEVAAVGKTEYDAKNRGRCIQIGFLRKVSSQRSNKRHRRKNKKLYCINGGIQE